MYVCVCVCVCKCWCGKFKTLCVCVCVCNALTLTPRTKYSMFIQKRQFYLLVANQLYIPLVTECRALALKLDACLLILYFSSCLSFTRYCKSYQVSNV